MAGRPSLQEKCELTFAAPTGTLISFALAVGVTASYAILVKHVSITPFVDTFLAALLVAIGWICLPVKNLTLLRKLLDICFVVNIAILFLEYVTKSLVIPSGTADFTQFRAIALSNIRLRLQFCLACIPSLTWRRYLLTSRGNACSV